MNLKRVVVTGLGALTPLGNNVKLIVYDLLGREIDILINEKQKSGSYEFEFYGSDLTSGIYFYRLQTGEFIETKKMVLLR